jgi:hypothetical protein
MHNLVPVWRDDTAIVDVLIEWLSTDDANDRAAALTALRGAALNDAHRIAVAHTVDGILRSQDSVAALFLAPTAMTLITAQGVADKLRAALTEVVEGHANRRHGGLFVATRFRRRGGARALSRGGQTCAKTW